jgi:hypothetical protein
LEIGSFQSCEAEALDADTLWAAIAAALDAFTPAECASYFTNSGYEPA